jgi:hypothetical protein
LSRQRNLDFITPKHLSIMQRVLACAKLYPVSDLVVGLLTGVKSHGSSGYPESPVSHKHFMIATAM